jgi:hypothetical protein
MDRWCITGRPRWDYGERRVRSEPSIKVISEPHTNEPQFIEARKAIAEADRVAFWVSDSRRAI